MEQAKAGTTGIEKSNGASPAPAGPESRPNEIRSGFDQVEEWVLLAALALVGVAAYFGWQFFQPAKLPEGFASSNGRIEATEIDVATKLAGRIIDELVDEGDFVTAGQVVAHMDIDVLTGPTPRSRAKLAMAKSAVETARSTLAQRESEKAAAEAVVAQREAELDLATKNFDRAEHWSGRCAMSREEFDTRRVGLFSAKAAVSSAKANVAAADAAISTAKAMIIAAEARRCRPGDDRTRPGGHRRQHLEGAARRPGAVPRLPARRGAERGREGAEHDRSQRRLHDLLPAHGPGPAASSWGPRSGWFWTPRRSSSSRPR